MNLEHQKCLLIRDYALPLKELPDGVPQTGEKCLFLPERNLCIPVYTQEEQSALKSSGPEDSSGIEPLSE